VNFKIVFMGTPEFAVPSLLALHENLQVIGVVTQPDRPAGRGRDMRSPAVKSYSVANNIPVIQPEKLDDTDFLDQLNSWNPDVIVVVAFAHILKAKVLHLPPHGCLNVHASLLPRWRGAAPIQAAILHGDKETGITIMTMNEKLDAGEIISQEAISIDRSDTAASLAEKLSILGAELLIDSLPGYLSGKIKPEPQDLSRSTYFPKIKKEQGQLDFTKTALELERQVRAFIPWPGSFFVWNEKRIKVLQAEVIPSPDSEPGVHLIYDERPAVGTAENALVLNRLQVAGKNPLSGREFLSGAQDWIR
jgi:methionyl-tRNA formyltransferase